MTQEQYTTGKRIFQHLTKEKNGSTIKGNGQTRSASFFVLLSLPKTASSVSAMPHHCSVRFGSLSCSVFCKKHL